jgi:phenylacetate-CoA ligase
MLRRLVRHAGTHVPYYRDLFREIDLDVDRFRGRIDLHRIPLLDKTTIRLQADRMVSENAGSFDSQWHRTSGSTGSPLRFMLSGESRIVDAAATLRAYHWAGFLPGMKVFTIKEYMRNWESCVSMAGRSLNADSMKLSTDSARRICTQIDRLRPGFFHGYPFAIAMLSKLAEDQGLAIHAPHTIITFGESLPPAMRRRIRSAYGGATIFDFYSMTENAVLITDCRCGLKHVHEEYAFHEFVDNSGHGIDVGRGEIVGTSFFNRAMPLIRYRTRDFARLMPSDGIASCGRAFRSVSTIEGRKEDFIRTPEGVVINLFEGPMTAGRGISASQYVQDAADHIYVNVVPGADFEELSLAAVEVELRQRVGPRMRIDFHVVSELERRHGDSGKVPFLLSKIGNDLYSAADFEEA